MNLKRFAGSQNFLVVALQTDTSCQKIEGSQSQTDRMVIVITEDRHLTLKKDNVLTLRFSRQQIPQLSHCFFSPCQKKTLCSSKPVMLFNCQKDPSLSVSPTPVINVKCSHVIIVSAEDLKSSLKVLVEFQMFSNLLQ